MTPWEPKSGNQTRTPATLNAKLNKGLMSYVAAASAAGIGMLAGTQPAEAEVVYTPANTPILINTPVALDLNNDGTIDFELSNNYRADDGIAKSCTICTFFQHASLKATPARAENAIWAIYLGSHHSSFSRREKKGKRRVEQVAAPVPWGAVVGGERKMEATPLVMDSSNFTFSYSDHYSSNSIGAWGKGRPFAGSYLGLKFTAGGEIHYGWARIIVKADFRNITATLTGYAYETVPNRGIITGVEHGTFDDSAETDSAEQAVTPAAPDPSTLGRLAQGATGVSAWRLRRGAAQNAAVTPGQ
jgi:hypothetical protein